MTTTGATRSPTRGSRRVRSGSSPGGGDRHLGGLSAKRLSSALYATGTPVGAGHGTMRGRGANDLRSSTAVAHDDVEETSMPPDAGIHPVVGSTTA